jgi:hypothetical protein
MSALQTELKDWIAGISGNDRDCEQRIRKLLLQDKSLLKDINLAYKDKNVIRVKRLIQNFLAEHKIIVRTCKYCKKKNMISSDYLVDAECEQCHKNLLGTTKIDSSKGINCEHDVMLNEKKKCIYCGKPVSSISNSITCYSCKNIRFDVYSNG